MESNPASDEETAVPTEEGQLVESKQADDGETAVVAEKEEEAAEVVVPSLAPSPPLPLGEPPVKSLLLRAKNRLLKKRRVATAELAAEVGPRPPHQGAARPVL